MTSPQPLTRKELEGASQTHGGLFQGCAFGNSLNIGDFWDFGDGEDLLPVPGKVMDKAKSKTRESARKEKSEREDLGEDKNGSKSKRSKGSKGSKGSKSSKTK